jgi:hypothetical protein
MFLMIRKSELWLENVQAKHFYWRKQIEKLLLHVKRYKLQVTSYKLQVTSYKLQVTSYKLQVTSCKLNLTENSIVDYVR